MLGDEPSRQSAEPVSIIPFRLKNSTIIVAGIAVILVFGAGGYLVYNRVSTFYNVCDLKKS